VRKYRFLEGVSVSGEALVNDERQEAPQLLGSGKQRAVEDPIELRADSGIR
jgi:hypothetical protein